MIQKSFKLRFYPTADQEIMLAKTFGCARFVWNKRVESFNNRDPLQPVVKDPSIKEMKVDYPWLAEVPYNALEQKLQDWRSTKTQYFNTKRKKKLGRPRFKNRNGKQSIRFSYSGFSYKDGMLKPVKLGRLDLVGYNLVDLPMESCKQITISRDASGKYYCSVLLSVEEKLKPLTGKKVGIDLGLKDLFILSDGQVINNPKWFRDNQSKLKKGSTTFKSQTKR